jgi:TM2 domain-containing membrane protein YozV/RNA polymerase subunit RPABC4/transcription elongation factor Spt4
VFCRNCGKELIETSEICPYCKAKSLAGTNFCLACGTQTEPQAETCLKCGAKLTGAIAEEISSKSRLTVTLLAFFLGAFGAHRFYLHKMRTATLMLLLGIFGIASYVLTLAILGHPTFPIWVGIVALAGLISLLAVAIWALVDFVFVASGRMQDKEGEPIKKWK